MREVHLDGRAGIDAALVRRLIATQFPQWRDLPVTPVAVDGWDNRWLPILAPSLPVAVPVPWRRGDRAGATHFAGQFGPGSMAEPH